MVHTQALPVGTQPMETDVELDVSSLSDLIEEQSCFQLPRFDYEFAWELGVSGLPDVEDHRLITACLTALLGMQPTLST